MAFVLLLPDINSFCISSIAVLNMYAAGKFSADRAIREYAKEIWGVK